MNPNEREDSSTYVDRSAEEPKWQRDETPVVTQPAPREPKKSRAARVLAFLLVLALIGAAALAYLWYQENARADAATADLRKADAQITQLKQAVAAEDTDMDSDTTVEVDTTDSESEAVIKAALAYMQAPVQPLGNQNAKIEYLQDGFAKVVVTTGDPGMGGPTFALTLKESDGDWIVLSAAEGPVADMDQLMSMYGIPREAF